jgi:alpha-1,6-mannosyltransferase
MRIVDTTMFFARESGGVKRYLLAKHAWLACHKNICHTLLVPGAADSDDGAGIVTLTSPPLPFGNGYHCPVGMKRWRDRMHDLEPDLIEAGDPYQLAWAALRVGRVRNIPVVGFYHSDLTRLIGARLGGWGAPGVGRYVANLYKRFDLVLAPSEAMIENLRALGVERVALQPLGVNTRIFHPRRRDPNLRIRMGLRDDTRLLLFAGRFAREKNIPVLLEAAQRLGPRYHLLLVGGGGRLRLPANVSRYPYVGSENALARIMASCDAFVHGGDKETFGLVILEAMACGVPVVGIAAGAVGELVDETVGMPVSRSDPQLLTQAIAALFERDLQAVGRRCRERAEAGYNWDKVLRSLLDNYRRLAANAMPLKGMKLRAVS